MKQKHVSAIQIGRAFGVTRNAVIKWRVRYDDFPKPVAGNDAYPLYDLREVQRWYVNKWPNRTAQWQTRIHHISVTEKGTLTTTMESSSPDHARGYIAGVRDSRFGDWRVFHTRDGFCAEKGNETHVWVIDPTDADPEPWYTYVAKFKTIGRTK